MDGDKVDFQVLLYKEKIHEDYSLTTIAQAEENKESVMEAYKSPNVFKQKVRLKNGFLKYKDDQICSIKPEYQEGINYKLISRVKSGSKVKEDSEEDCLIALAYAAEHDDVKEVKELVERAGQAGLDILKTGMPFARLGTVLHVCTDWNSIQTLEKLLHGYPPESFDVYIVDRDGESALHNLCNYWHVASRSYDDCKRGASLLLHAHGVDANKLLSIQGKYYNTTALCKALVHRQKQLCNALLDTAAEIAEAKKDPSTGKSDAPHWLKLEANGSIRAIFADKYRDDSSEKKCTALHLAVLLRYGDIVSKILVHPGANKLNLTSHADHNGNTPLHLAAKVGDADICSKLLKYGMKDGSGRLPFQQNKAGETALHLAATHGRADVCEMLLLYGASLSSRDKRGRSALTHAFVKRHRKVVKILLDACVPTSHNTSAQAPDDHLQATPSTATGDLISAKSKGSLHERHAFGLTPLHIAVAISAPRRIRRLIDAGAPIDSTSDDGSTPLHIAVQRCDKNTFIELLESANKRAQHEKQSWLKMKDNWGQTALHKLVSLYSSQPTKDHRRTEISCELEESTDEDIEESTHPDSDEVICDMVKKLLEEAAWVNVQDCNGETPLHAAARQGNHKVVETLLSAAEDKNFRRGINERDQWISRCDFTGETALHEAARAGDLYSVVHLLQKTDKPDDLVRIRDMQNKTALDWAALRKNKSIMDVMMNYGDLSASHQIKPITKEFLMWHLKEHIKPGAHQEYCKRYNVTVDQTQLLRTAVDEKNVDIARSVINRGADVSALDIDQYRWLAKNLGKATSDRPTSEDTLGRGNLVQGVATLLLNPYTETPITIGIFGSWGSGKSSFMLQVEEAMLCMAVKETFRKTPHSSFLDKTTSMVKFSRSGVALRYMVVEALKKRMIKADKYNKNAYAKGFLNRTFSNPDIEKGDDILDNFPTELQSKYHQLFKDLALTDRSKLVQSRGRAWYERKVGIQSQTFKDASLIACTPVVLTLHYNAWQYDNKTEASAGLAIEISRQLESFMTPHQWLRMCWEYSWKHRPRYILQHLILPTLLTIVAVCVILMLWKFVSISTKYKALSLPVGIVSVLGALFKACLQVIQPVTQTLLSSTKSIDHQSMLGYQHQVIDDIKFLKFQLCEDAHFGWKILSLLCIIFISNSYFMEDTWIWRQYPRLNNFRVVVFIDDLDRCDEKTVLELLRTINLILGSCGINVVMGVDKDMLQRAIIREFLKDTSDKVLEIWGDRTTLLDEKGQQVALINTGEETIEEGKDSRKLKGSKKVTKDEKYSYSLEVADIYLQKIIQLPIQLPDPSEKNIEEFLDVQVGQQRRALKEDKAEESKTKDQSNKQMKDKRENNEEIQMEKEKGGGGSKSSKLITEDIRGVQIKDEGDVQNQDGTRSDKSCCIGVVIEEGFNKEEHKKDEGDPQSEDGTKNVASEETAFRLLLANYTPMEKDMLRHLCRSATKERRILREWKRFLNYHRLAWTIFSQDPSMKGEAFEGWQRKLILWIFICWIWRAQMDIIFKNWNEIMRKSSTKWREQMHLQGKGEYDNTIQQELSDIILTYMENMKWNVGKDINQNKGEREDEIDEVPPKSWSDLYRTLKEEYDIPIHFIEKFQQFSFYCVLNHLEIDPRFKPKTMALMDTYYTQH